MQTSRLLGIVSGLAVLSGSLYVTFAYLTSPAAPMLANSHQAAESGEGYASELGALRQDFLRLRAEFASLRRQESGVGKLHSELSRLQNEVRALRQQVQDSAELASYDNAGIIDAAPETPADREDWVRR